MGGTLPASIAHDHRIAEAEALRRLRSLYPAEAAATRVTERARALAARARAARPGAISAESFLRHYDLSSREGIALMCVAEALLRIPDPDTADALLRDKLAGGQWGDGDNESLFASAADWGLMLTGTLVRWQDSADDGPGAQLKRLVARLGEPLVRAAVRQAMRILAEQFVLAETIEEAVIRGMAHPLHCFSYDMLGEGARTAEDAARYFDSYLHAVNAISAPDTLSIKLSAMHPRFEEAKRARIFAELLPNLRELARIATGRSVGLTIDAEESERLELTLDVHAALSREFSLGLAVQAYQKRALSVCEWLIELGRSQKRRLSIRLVKGAYWDGEIKRAQQLGMPDYPIFTHKPATDVSYIACAARLLSAPDAIYPAFATHNCRTVATILEIAGHREFELQKLWGMGDALYEALLVESDTANRINCRIYAPVGRHNELLPYLVRRILENGANTSFVHQIADPDVPLDALVADPLAALPLAYTPDPRIPLPRNLYPDRLNSLGQDLCRRSVLQDLHEKVLSDREHDRPAVALTNANALNSAIARASEAFESWSRIPATERATVLERAADLFEERRVDLVSLIVREGKRTYSDAVSEVREAADFCRYYALQARTIFLPSGLPGPAGERNELALHGRGVFSCISPWNFPLAIFTGQCAAALAAGNTVIAKPAEQTPRIALQAIALLQAAGVPTDAAICAIGDGESVGAPLVADPRIAGVAFTGSIDTARRINAALAAREGPIIPLIAETGGVNAMLVDSSALPEQVVDDVVVSAFQSAGQRCSAQRILFVEESGAPRVLRLIAGALAELKVGDPAEPDTDVGPIIDAPAHAILARHVANLRRSAKLIGESILPEHLPEGPFIAPIAFEVPFDALPRIEIFGPILHVATFRRSELDTVLTWLRGTGYGLTLGIHSRIESFVDEVVRSSRVGNIYVNRSMIGAVVGVQPFGGEGLSGTGPKAGGPHYLQRFATERTLTVNTAAVGGVTELLTDRS